MILVKSAACVFISNYATGIRFPTYHCTSFFVHGQRSRNPIALVRSSDFPEFMARGDAAANSWGVPTLFVRCLPVSLCGPQTPATPTFPVRTALSYAVADSGAIGARSGAIPRHSAFGRYRSKGLFGNTPKNDSNSVVLRFSLVDLLSEDVT